MIIGGELNQDVRCLDREEDCLVIGKNSKSGLGPGCNMSRRYAGIRGIKDDVYEISFYPYSGAKRKQYRIRAASM